ncbi:hypothetical protein OGAPHI_002330 [Ogataea philodendri]|uniref:Peroxisome assembly protein 12 n=1 Tax=Ogataea philodendri TaxID=1378263 RepID=A0A9P8PB88_9ASCO|nr:uncharacterized protein OGAPHI_002330 [Ogataea philodendri]KAH3668576.1 hypothetical protein OGAPHI_002330 [Ogataea philodendri]
MDFYSNLDSRSLDRETPTLFEVISAKELEQLLSPSVRFVLIHYANRYPRQLIRLLNHFDELNLVVRGFIEYSILRNWNSTFIEKFYGIKRCNKLNLSLRHGNHESSAKFDTIKRLKKTQIFASLAEIVLVPYLREKLDLLYDKLLPEYLLDKLKPKENTKDLIKYWFLKLYPSISSILKLINILIKVLFLSGKIKSTNLLQFLFNIQYSRLNQFDHKLAEDRTAKFLKTTSSAPQTSRIRPVSLTESVADLYASVSYPFKRSFLVTSESILPVSIFLLKFLEWWNTSEINKNFGSSVVSTKTPQLPQLLNSDALKSEKVRSKLTTSTGDCPLCHEPIHNPAIIETGYVFCYKCIYTYLKEGDEDGGKCPVTGKKLIGCKYSQTAKEWKVTNVRRLMI